MIEHVSDRTKPDDRCPVLRDSMGPRHDRGKSPDNVFPGIPSCSRDVAKRLDRFSNSLLRAAHFPLLITQTPQLIGTPPKRHRGVAGRQHNQPRPPGRVHPLGLLIQEKIGCNQLLLVNFKQWRPRIIRPKGKLGLIIEGLQPPFVDTSRHFGGGPGDFRSHDGGRGDPHEGRRVGNCRRGQDVPAADPSIDQGHTAIHKASSALEPCDNQMPLVSAKQGGLFDSRERKHLRTDNHERHHNPKANHDLEVAPHIPEGGGG
mmetsp:Transcript_31227/g.70280  ORF Transcript_31227/g.70280 Transcript_31227/m.70280 type:complete len:260 (-) Transcript_31227:4-783(-)